MDEPSCYFFCVLTFYAFSISEPCEVSMLSSLYIEFVGLFFYDEVELLILQS